MKQGLLVLALFLSGCAGTMKPIKIYSVPAELQPYVDMFIYEAAQRGKHYTIDNLIMQVNNSFSDTYALGTCELFINPTIVLQENFFHNWGTAINKEQVVFHEFGHCLLGRGHNDTMIAHNGETIFKSIMNSYMFNQYYYGTYRDYYLDELFGVN